ncbi:DNA mismatch repair endonuclease MutL [Candidatus Gracilibacteria bacterium]|nr:DNA mismatch repair endonuclease MutL [Candidatus Gracilibacteria bacterium]
MPIKILPQSISDQIAAGEVVERPASVVKELIENSLDAGASQLEIRILDGGKKIIEVMDDGQGMSLDDAKKCILRHATSKIDKIDDLFQIQSFGFRGEALAAISAVSKFNLITKISRETSGTRLKISGGRNLETFSVPANKGTIIRVEDLFFTTPARLSYLKSKNSEERAIIKEVQNFALSNPEVSFKLFKEDKLVLDFKSVKTPKTRIQQVLKEFSDNLIKVKSQNGQTSLSGFVSSPGSCTKTKQHQFLFVNGRHIEDYKINFAVREAYRQSAGIEKGMYPVFVLFLDMDPILVDVNVHPRKLEVKFAEPQEIFSLVKNAVTTAISQTAYYNITPSQAPSFSTPQSSYPSRSRSLKTEPASLRMNFSQRNLSRTQNSPFPKISKEVSPELRLVGQIAHRYIAAESEDGIYLFDQHALHERQRFNQFWKEWQISSTKIQKLLTPQKLKLPEDIVSILYEYKKYIANLGFSMVFSCDNEISITEVPQTFSKENLNEVFQNLVEYFINEQIGEASPDILMRKLIEYKSCRGAVKFGDKLSSLEMQKLLSDFDSSEWQSCCAHGRPNNIFLPFQQLDREFHR